MTNQPISLYGYATSPFVMKVACYLKYKGLDYTHVHVTPGKNTEIKWTGQTQVPVLKIGEEWRKDSSKLGIWLDELYPEKPLLGETDADRQSILGVDGWISDAFIPARFREAIDPDSQINAIRNGWKLAACVHGGTPIPRTWRLMWPFVVRKAPFIIAMVDQLDRSEPMKAMRARMLDELEAHIGDGPFLASQRNPSLADFSAFPVVTSGYMMGMAGDFGFLHRPRILGWLKSVKSHLPQNPYPFADRFMKRDWPF